MKRNNSGSESEEDMIISKKFFGIVLPSEGYECKFIKKEEVEEKDKDELKEIFESHEEDLQKFKIFEKSLDFEYLGSEDIKKDEDEEHTHDLKIILGKKSSMKSMSIMVKNVEKGRVRVKAVKEYLDDFYLAKSYEVEIDICIEFHAEMAFFAEKSKFLLSCESFEESLPERIDELDKKDRQYIVQTMIKTALKLKPSKHILERLEVFGNLVLEKKLTSLKLKSKYAVPMLDCLNQCSSVNLDKIKNVVCLVLSKQKNNADNMFLFLKTQAQLGKKQVLELLKSVETNHIYNDEDDENEEDAMTRFKKELIEIYDLLSKGKKKISCKEWEETIAVLAETFDDKKEFFEGFELFLKFLIENSNKVVTDKKKKKKFYTFLFENFTKLQFNLFFENIQSMKKHKLFIKISMDYFNSDKINEQISESLKAFYCEELLDNEDFLECIRKEKIEAQQKIYEKIPIFKEKIFEKLDKCQNGKEDPVKTFKDLMDNELLILFVKNQLNEEEDENLKSKLKATLESIESNFFQLLSFFETKKEESEEFEGVFTFLLSELILLNYQKIEKTDEICKMMVLCMDKSMAKNQQIRKISVEMLNKLKNKSHYTEIIKNFKMLYSKLKGEEIAKIDKHVLGMKFDEVDLQNNFKKKEIWELIFESGEDINAYELHLAFNLFKIMHKKFQSNKDFSKKLKQETFGEDVVLDFDGGMDAEEENPNEEPNEQDKEETKEAVQDEDEDDDSLLKIISDFNKRFFKYFKTFTKTDTLESQEVKEINLLSLLQSGSKKKKSKKKAKSRARFKMDMSPTEDEDDSDSEEDENEKSENEEEEESSDSDCNFIYFLIHSFECIGSIRRRNSRSSEGRVRSGLQGHKLLLGAEEQHRSNGNVFLDRN